MLVLFLESLSAQTSALKSVGFIIGTVNLVSYTAPGNNSIFILHRNIWPIGHFAYSGFIKIAASGKKK